MSKGCLIDKLSTFSELSEGDRKLLVKLEAEERECARDTIIRRKGEVVTDLHVVKTGWLTSFSVLDDGRRQLLRLFYPGDIVDLSQVALARAQHDVKCLTVSVLCPFPKAGLDTVFASSPRLTALLFAITVKETNTLLDRIRAIGRFSAYERLCYLLLEISDRLRLTTVDVDDGFHLPLTQSDIADLIGLTNVYVSKTMSRIEKDGLIRREGSRIILVDAARMRRICEYAHDTRIDTSWFPPS